MQVPCIRSWNTFGGVTAALLAGLALTGCPVDAPNLDPQPNGPGVHWLRFGHITDAQIVDEESPARSVLFDGLISTAWRPQEAYGVQTLDATLGVLNARHVQGEESGRPLDFVIVTGDHTDNAQYNELRWFIDTMDGQVVTPDSGDLDGELRDVAPEDNPKLPYAAIGLDEAIPWYTAYGNHDGLALGNFVVDRRAANAGLWQARLNWIVAEVLGLHRISPLLNALVPTLDQSPAIILGREERIDPETLQLRIDELTPGAIVADGDRHFISKSDFIEEHFNTTTTPAGHGFTSRNQERGTVSYTVRPVEDVPIRLVVMDTVASDPDESIPAFYGVMTREHFEDFVKPRIRAAKRNGEFVILASHHPISDFDIPSPGDTVAAFEFRTFLTLQSNIIAHIAGHSHRHHVQQIAGLFPYLEIETASIIDYPQEGRILDVFYLRETRSIRIESTVIGHMENPTRLSEESFRRASIDRDFSKGAQPGAEGLDVGELFSGAGQEMTIWNGWKLRSKEERYGREVDRNFSITLPRPDMDVAFVGVARSNSV